MKSGGSRWWAAGLALGVLASVLVPVVDDPRPAAASSHEFEVWSADLTVGTAFNFDVGCNNAWVAGMGSPGFQCSDPSVLTADRLVLPDRSGYNIEQIVVPGNPADGGLLLVLHKTLPLAAREGMTLHVAFGSQTAAYPLSDATESLGRTIGFPTKTGGNRLFDAASGDTVSLRLTLPAVAPLGPGSLDPTFGIGGTVTSDFGTMASEIHAAAEQSDGKIVVAGFVQSGAGNRDFALARYNTDGSLDTSFGTDGRVVTDVGAGANDEARAVAVQSDGKIVVAGYASVSGLHDFALARYNTDGSLDTGFGKITGNTRTGSATYSLGPTDTAYAVAVQTDGKIVAAGQAGNDFGLLRVHPAGDPDGDRAAMGSTPAYTGFGGDGRVTTDMVSGDGVSGLPDGARALAIDSVGKIVVAGFATSTAGTPSDTSDDHKDMAVARYTTQGALDTSFSSSSGIAYFDFGSTVDEAHSVTILFDGKIIIGGRSDEFLALIKVTAAGVSDTDFGSSGGTSFKPTAHTDAQVWAVAETSDLQLIVAGQAGNDFYTARLTAAGEIVREFVQGGSASGERVQRFFNFAGGVSRARAMVLRSDDSFVVAGFAHNGSHNTFALARLTPEHDLDERFGVGGKVTTGFRGGRAESAEGVAYSPDYPSGEIVVVGHAHNGTDDDFLVARYHADDGSLFDGFGIRGRVFTDFGSGSDRAFDVALASDGKIVVVGRAHNGTDFDFAVARYNRDGSLDTAFDTDGKVVTDFGSGDDGAQSVVIASDGKIVVGGYASNGVENDFALVRYNADGSLDTAFDTDGKVTTDFDGDANVVYGLAVASDNKIVAVGSGAASFGLARYTTAGALDTTFGTAGKVSTELSGLGDEARAVALQADGRIVVAGRAVNESGTTNTQDDDHNDFALARYNTAGVLDTTFGTAGKVTTDFGGFYDEVRAVAVQRDGRIVAAGPSSSNDWDFALARYNAAGALDTTFGTGGKVITGDGLTDERAKSAALQGDGKIVVAGNGWGAGFALARYLRGPSAKVYRITPAVTVSEIQDALLELTLGVPAPAGGVTFDVTYGYLGSASAGDLVYPPATVTVKENQTTATLTLAFQPDGIVEGTETLPVTVSTTAPGWEPLVDTATVTITDNDIATARIGFGTPDRQTPYTASVARNVAGGSINVPIVVNHLAASDFTVHVEVLSTSTAVEYSDAQNPGDFRIADKSVTYRRGASSQNLSVAITNTADMDDKVIKLRITDSSAKDLGPRFARQRAVYMAMVPELASTNDLGQHFARHPMGRLADITITPRGTPPSPTTTTTTQPPGPPPSPTTTTTTQPPGPPPTPDTDTDDDTDTDTDTDTDADTDTAGFTDVDPAGAHAASIDALYAAGVTRGCGMDPLRFCPGDSVTRAQMASFLVRALKLDAADTAGFTDVDPAGAHAASIDALYAAGVTRGCGMDPLRFCPGDSVTRAQMASFLVRALKLDAADTAGFTDVDPAGAHAASIDALYAAGVTRGCGMDPLRFCPGDSVTRAQMASFLVRALKLPTP